MQKHMSLLGMHVKDQITNLDGVVESVCFDLYGCVQASVRRTGIDKDGKLYEGYWFDVKRLVVKSTKPVMAVPDFELPEIGAADKPTRRG
jgi:hypothetical protein